MDSEYIRIADVNMSIEALKVWVSTAESVAKILAIFIGGLWTYSLFVRQRLRYPKAELELVVDQVPLGTGKKLLHCALKITNNGDVLLHPEKCELRLRQVIPMNKEIESRFQEGCDPVGPGEYELKWPVIAQRGWGKVAEIEPGESDKLHTDFVINADVQLVQLYGFVGNPRKKNKNFGWSLTRVLPTLGD